ncbi:MAG: hypothetical protein M1820_000438 [Bogoriella megaspora]|nr:MAG: hypothetical protein M1820_000438 [Bogoriella megaspora]
MPTVEPRLRTERLERRIEELAAQLAAHRNELPNASNNSQSSTTEETPVGLSTPPVSEEALEKVSRCASEFNDIPFPPAHPEKGADVVERGLIAPGLAEELVQKFKTAKTPVFPFVVIPPAVTAQTLRQEKPFLFLAVITACLEDDVMLQRRIAEEIRHEISTRLIMDNEKSLEMLQGLLVYLSWYYYHFVPKSHQMYLLLNIARALVFDLCLDRNPAANAQELGLLLEIKMRLALPPKCDMSDDVADGKRAILYMP